MSVDNSHINATDHYKFCVNVGGGTFKWFRELVVKHGYVYGGNKPAYGKFLEACYQDNFVVLTMDEYKRLKSGDLGAD